MGRSRRSVCPVVTPERTTQHGDSGGSNSGETLRNVNKKRNSKLDMAFMKIQGRFHSSCEISGSQGGEYEA
jgi:hypothetical protein